ncbi:MAG: 4a-hydroxytetrahydrobiopterin dehydratase [Pseudomonadota bacterium]
MAIDDVEESTMSETKLNDQQIAEALSVLSGWTVDDGKLFKEYVFPNFVEAFGFMTKAALVVEKMNHHPEWFNVYGKLRVHLTTHELGGISTRDTKLAEALDRLAA